MAPWSPPATAFHGTHAVCASPPSAGRTCACGGFHLPDQVASQRTVSYQERETDPRWLRCSSNRRFSLARKKANSHVASGHGGATELGARVVPRSSEQPLTNTQEGFGDLRPTNAINWILLTTWVSLEEARVLEKTTVKTPWPQASAATESRGLGQVVLRPLSHGNGEIRPGGRFKVLNVWLWCTGKYYHRTQFRNRPTKHFLELDLVIHLKEQSMGEKHSHLQRRNWT